MTFDYYDWGRIETYVRDCTGEITAIPNSTVTITPDTTITYETQTTSGSNYYDPRAIWTDTPVITLNSRYTVADGDWAALKDYLYDGGKSKVERPEPEIEVSDELLDAIEEFSKGENNGEEEENGGSPGAGDNGLPGMRSGD